MALLAIVWARCGAIRRLERAYRAAVWAARGLQAAATVLALRGSCHDSEVQGPIALVAFESECHRLPDQARRERGIFSATRANVRLNARDGHANVNAAHIPTQIIARDARVPSLAILMNHLCHSCLAFLVRVSPL